MMEVSSSHFSHHFPSKAQQVQVCGLRCTFDQPLYTYGWFGVIFFPEFLLTTWRIIPLSKWLITMVSKSPKWGYSPYKWPKWLINGGY